MSGAGRHEEDKLGESSVIEKDFKEKMIIKEKFQKKDEETRRKRLSYL